MPDNKQSENEFLPTRASLLSRIRNHEDNDSWSVFHETYHDLIYRRARQAGLSETDAEDVVQDTFIKVSDKIREFRYDPDKGQFKGWLLKLTRNCIIDHFRSHQKGINQRMATGDDRRTDVMERVADPDALARIEAAWDQEWAQNLKDAVAKRIKRKVKPKHYQMFELCYLRQMPVKEVAQILGVNVALVYLVKHRVGKLWEAELRRLHEQGI